MGEDDGLALGRLVGKTDGLELGAGDGAMVGNTDGSLEGLSDGFGLTLGLVLGDADSDG